METRSSKETQTDDLVVSPEFSPSKVASVQACFEVLRKVTLRKANKGVQEAFGKGKVKQISPKVAISIC